MSNQTFVGGVSAPLTRASCSRHRCPEHHRSDLDSALPHTLSAGRCVAPALNGVKTELPLLMGPGTLIFCPFATLDDRAPMSRRTAQLLNRPAPARSVWRERFGEAANLLVAQYGIPRLGNYLDPVREIFYILLCNFSIIRDLGAAHRGSFPYLHCHEGGTS